MADRNPSFYGPILPQPPNAPDAFSFEELRKIRDRRRAADDALRVGSAWPERRRFETLYPPPCCQLLPETG
jgi:hypothetical protein